jgi:hypothetical protein
MLKKNVMLLMGRPHPLTGILTEGRKTGVKKGPMGASPFAEALPPALAKTPVSPGTSIPTSNHRQT